MFCLMAKSSGQNTVTNNHKCFELMKGEIWLADLDDSPLHLINVLCTALHMPECDRTCLERSNNQNMLKHAYESVWHAE